MSQADGGLHYDIYELQLHYVDNDGKRNEVSTDYSAALRVIWA
jgi:hypothetical protein